MIKRTPVILLSFIVATVGISWLFSAVPETQAQSGYNITDLSYWIENGYYTDTMYYGESLFYSDTTTAGYTYLTLGEIQSIISTTQAIATDDVTLYFRGIRDNGGANWSVTAYYTDGTSNIYYANYISGSDLLYDTLPDGKYIDYFELYTSLQDGATSYHFNSIFIDIPIANVGAVLSVTTPTPVTIPTPDPVVTYSWGGVVPAPITYTNDLTVTLALTPFWNIDNYEFALSVTRTVWGLPWLPEALSILGFFAAVSVGFVLFTRIMRARSSAEGTARILAVEQELNREQRDEVRNNLLNENLQVIRNDLRRQSATGLRSSFYTKRGRGFGRGFGSGKSLW